MPVPGDAVPPSMRGIGRACPDAFDGMERIGSHGVMRGQEVDQSESCPVRACALPHIANGVHCTSRTFAVGRSDRCVNQGARLASPPLGQPPLVPDVTEWGGRCASVPRVSSGRPFWFRWQTTEQRRRRNSRVRSGVRSGGKSRARSRAYSRACGVTAAGRVVGRVSSRVLPPVSLPVANRAAPPLAPQSK